VRGTVALGAEASWTRRRSLGPRRNERVRTRTLDERGARSLRPLEAADRYEVVTPIMPSYR
jgi:hypothetical protein